MTTASKPSLPPHFAIVLSLMAVAGAVTGALALASAPSARQEPAGADTGNLAASLGSAIPGSTTPFIMAALVGVEGPGLESDAFLYVSRKTFNRLRDECAVSVDCDAPGLRLRVTAGEGAGCWNIPAGASLELVELRSGVPVPETIVAGDAWFLSGDAVVATPCEPATGG